ncbi:MAG: ACP S-malonyltransferase [Akkermansia sp.]|nr:ACP S-malonyltransferase [Akkermansia sp.]
MRAVLLFPGQGAQQVGMGKDLMDAYPAARALMEAADAALGRKLTDVMFSGPDAELTRTSNCQPALYVHGLALWSVLRERVQIEPVAAAGLSLGEFTAHAAAGTFTMVEKRGALMEEACAATAGSMAALVAGTPEAAVALAQECDVDVANFNCPGQIVLSGSVEGIDKAVAGAKAAGFKRGIKLNVAGAYHSRYMKPAQTALLPVLDATPMQSPAFPVYCNYGGRTVEGPDDTRAMLGAQVCGSVRWQACMEALVSQGERLFIEMGPGTTLAGMMARICADARVVSIQDAATLEAAVAELQG